MTRRYPEDRITIPEIKKHPWFHGAIDLGAFDKFMAQKVTSIGDYTRDRVTKEIQISYSASQCLETSKMSPLADALRKMMLDFKQRLQKSKKEYKSSFPSGKSSSEGDSLGVEQDELPKHEEPPCMPHIHKRGESWSSISSNDDHSS